VSHVEWSETDRENNDARYRDARSGNLYQRPSLWIFVVGVATVRSSRTPSGGAMNRPYTYKPYTYKDPTTKFNETKLRDKLREMVLGPHWWRIENRFGKGVPDLNACYNSKEIWVETKVRRGPFALVTEHQKNWHRDRIAAGGTTFFLLGERVGRGKILVTIWSGSKGTELIEKPYREVPGYMAELSALYAPSLLRVFFEPGYFAAAPWSERKTA